MVSGFYGNSPRLVWFQFVVQGKYGQAKAGKQDGKNSRDVNI
jgi:hypothetical protein